MKEVGRRCQCCQYGWCAMSGMAATARTPESCRPQPQSPQARINSKVTEPNTNSLWGRAANVWVPQEASDPLRRAGLSGEVGQVSTPAAVGRTRNYQSDRRFSRLARGARTRNVGNH